ncbi:hypothetical protein Lal_00006499 [Lupinus albus]|nr:hypothetical protein Lal_00006499 [Lupinus albus]
MTGETKVNTDGAANGSPGQVGDGGIFRDSNGVFIVCFASYLEIQDALYAELYSAMKAIHMAYKRGWWTLWLECDSSLVVDIFNYAANAPWKLQNDCLSLEREDFAQAGISGLLSLIHLCSSPKREILARATALCESLARAREWRSSISYRFAAQFLGQSLAQAALVA